MIPHSEATGIHCPIGLYEKCEGEIARLTEAINHLPTVPEKMLAAQDLRECVAVLLGCAAYDEGNQNCGLCRKVATLRDKTISVIQKAGALAH
jgi:hypothetical protein